MKKNTKGNEKTQGNKEREQLRDKVRDLRNTAAVELAFVGALTELGHKAANEYDGVDSKLRSMGTYVFTDWQGLLCMVEEHTEAAKEALEKMDELMSGAMILKATSDERS
ncbi:MAG: hypothetical protein ABSH25_07330 [Syntrophorhabdales bacterium]|jgi:dihydroorotase-like cyclic amidohydrolase